ncbi:Carboxymuconolactone decarboxylase [Pseudodesulfovibrio mercurii]|uniref:Carboxymuconolactone decarboxylase n=1 Tax=Pseudodesulfovibrio mercurii TaxID=641491 RepID=F0JHZ6_9BACT|nr:carboxymuconolactone decarboxylase family protein [Pseudodesulfovibrio mercurii]EGB14126.1 Carboxymuconolactone decarboxylase [Pseudodesulfovibrio mercurii]
MIEKQTELLAANEANAKTFKRLMPEVAEPYNALNREVYRDGAVSGKHKRLMALASALCIGCRACVLFQCRMALDLGATVDEILETCAVTLALRGTTGMGETERVVGYLRELGLIEE